MAPNLPTETWALIRDAYEHTDRPVEAICAEHGISSATLRDRMRRWDWTRRRQPISPEGPPPSPPPARALPPLAAIAPVAESTPSHPPDAEPHPAGETPLAATPAPDLTADAFGDASIATIVRRLQGAIYRALPAIEATTARLAARPAHPREMEQAARAFSTLTRTVRALDALLSQHAGPAPEDRVPENRDEFVAELVRRMNHFAAQHAAPRGDQSAGN